MYKNNNTMGYFTVKAMEALLFTEKIEEEYKTICEIINADNLDFLAFFKELLDNYSEYIDGDMKRNIFYITEHFRHKYPDGELRKQAFDLTNEIITIVNRSSEKGMNDFIADQLKNRYCASNRDIRRGIQNSDLTIKYLKADMVDDLYILETHSHLLTDEEFERIVPLFTDAGNDYLASVNYMLDEYPDLTEEEIFMQRVRLCASIYEHNVQTFNGNDEFVDIKLARRIVKQYKRSSTK